MGLLNHKAFVNKLQEKYGNICESFVSSTHLIWLNRGYLTRNILNPSLKNKYFLCGNKAKYFKDLGINFHGIAYNKDFKS